MSEFQLKMKRSMRKNGSNIILNLDLPPNVPSELLSRSLKILKQVHEHICAVKLNRQLTLPLGLFNGVQEILKLAHEYDLPVIMDCKINDVGHTNKIIAEYYFKAGFDAVIANPFVGWKQGLEPVFKVAREMQKGVILLVYMSHEAAAEGYGQTIKLPETEELVPQYIVFARKALLWNADGVIVGATCPEKIRKVHEILRDKIPIYSPGIGVQGGDIESTVRAGARYLLVGRAITLAEAPQKAARHYREIVKQLLKL